MVMVMGERGGLDNRDVRGGSDEALGLRRRQLTGIEAVLV